MVVVNKLDLWKSFPKLSVHEFICLLFGIEPEKAKFSYDNPEGWPEGAWLVYRALTEDIEFKKLDVVFDNSHIEDLAYARAHHTAEPFWTDGKLYRHQLVKWLAERGIPSKIFSETQTTSVQVPAQPSGIKGKKVKPAPVVNEPPPPEITQEEAAKLAGVDERTIRNWEKGIGRPLDYPERLSRTAFVSFVARREHKKDFNDAVRAVKRARPAGDMSEFSESGFSEEEDN